MKSTLVSSKTQYRLWKALTLHGGTVPAVRKLLFVFIAFSYLLNTCYVCGEGDGGEQIESDNVLFGLAANLCAVRRKKIPKNVEDSGVTILFWEICITNYSKQGFILKRIANFTEKKTENKYISFQKLV